MGSSLKHGKVVEISVPCMHWVGTQMTTVEANTMHWRRASHQTTGGTNLSLLITQNPWAAVRSSASPKSGPMIRFS